MNAAIQKPERRVRRAIGRLLSAVDLAIEAGKQVERARRDLERESDRLRGLRLVGDSDKEEG